MLSCEAAAPRGGGLMRLVAVYWTRRGEPFDLCIGSIAFESVFSLLSRVHHTREQGCCPRLRKLSVQDARKRLRRLSARNARRVGVGRGKRGGGYGRLAAGSCAASQPLRRRGCGGRP